MKPQMAILPTNPSPYEYALLSRAAYYNDIHDLEARDKSTYDALDQRGWRLQASIVEKNGYFGSIWVHDDTCQLVIAHRGSENIESWLTDYESVIQRRKGTFIRSALDTLSHDDVLHYEKQGYRISSTGHSLGGFLAQVCVYWSKRREFQAPSTGASSSSDSGTNTARIASNLRAMVFDSPGAYDFMRALQSNLPAEQRTINLDTLDIHNFCPTLTVVNTFGTQAGTMWHLGGTSEDVALPFFNAHKMENFLHCFNPATGQAHRPMQITDWPQLNEFLDNLPKKAVSKFLKAPFDFMNNFYKWFASKFGRDAHTPTWYNQLFTDPQSAIRVALSSDPDMTKEAFTELMNAAIHAHYAKLSTEQSHHSLALHHFELQAQVFLSDLAKAKTMELERAGWHEIMTEIYGEDAKLLQGIDLQQYGERWHVVLPLDYPGNMFMFQSELHRIMTMKGVVTVVDFMHENLERMNTFISEAKAKIATLEQTLAIIGENKQVSDQIQTLSAKVNVIESYLAQSKTIDNTAYIRSAIASEADTHADRFLSVHDYTDEQLKRNLLLIQAIQPGRKLVLDSAEAAHAGSSASVFSPGSGDDAAKVYAGRNMHSHWQSPPPQGTASSSESLLAPKR